MPSSTCHRIARRPTEASIVAGMPCPRRHRSFQLPPRPGAARAENAPRRAKAAERRKDGARQPAACCSARCPPGRRPPTPPARAEPAAPRPASTARAPRTTRAPIIPRVGHCIVGGVARGQPRGRAQARPALKALGGRLARPRVEGRWWPPVCGSRCVAATSLCVLCVVASPQGAVSRGCPGHGCCMHRHESHTTPLLIVYSIFCAQCFCHFSLVVEHCTCNLKTHRTMQTGPSLVRSRQVVLLGVSPFLLLFSFSLG